MLNNTTIDKFRESLRGGLVQPGEPEYDNARKVYNGMIDKRPRLIAYCADVADVISCVNFGRDNGMLISIWGGGHNAAGLGVCDDGLVINLSRMKSVRVDPVNKTARVEGGCSWVDVDHATHAFGLATPAGTVGSTGVAGLALGGGIGHLTRHYGLTIDNILEADMVLADGRFVTVSPKENEDLYWAIRGGGGNFGVVTSFLFKLHPVHTDYAGPMLWDIKDSYEMLKWYQDFIKEAPLELSGFFAFLNVPPGPPFPEHLHNKNVCGIVWCYSGPMEKAEEIFRPIRNFKEPILDFVGPIPHPVLQSLFDPLYPSGLQWYWKADFFNELNDDAIRQSVKFGSELPSPLSTTHIYPINGAAQKVGKNDTPWSYRDATFAHVMVGVDPDPANKNRITTWAKKYWESVHPYSAGGAYINFMMEEDDDRIKASYSQSYDRLVKIKNRYDPKNLFRVNQNIKPTV